jgi:PAS domain S-box-containing protein
MKKRPDKTSKPRASRTPAGSYRALRKRLDEAEQTLRAIRLGEVDAIVVGGPGGDRIFTLAGADHDYRVLMDEMSEGVATLGKGGLVSYCNARFATIVGLPAERIVGATIFSILPRTAKERVAALLQAGLLTVSKGEFQLNKKGEEPKTVLISVSKVAMDTGITQCVIATDLSEEKRREKEVAAERAERDAALRASEERYRRIVETAVEGIWLVDAEGRTTFANRALSDLLEYAPGELQGKPIFDFMKEESAAAARRFLGRRRRYGELREFGFRAKSGRELWALLSMSPIEGEGDTYAGAVVMVSDVSDRRKLQAQLLLADRMSSLGTLSAGVAHEINNPLAYVIASLDLVGERLPALDGLAREEGQFLEQQITRAREGTERVRKIVRDLKSFSRADEETVTVTDLVKSLTTSLTLVFNEIKHRARLVKDFDRLPPVRANEARLGQVFINLFVNAAQAMPEGDIEHNELRVIGRTDALGNAVVEIHDTGCGIPPDHLDRILSPSSPPSPWAKAPGSASPSATASSPRWGERSRSSKRKSAGGRCSASSSPPRRRPARAPMPRLARCVGPGCAGASSSSTTRESSSTSPKRGSPPCTT